MATKTIDSDLIIRGDTVIVGKSSDDYIYPLILKDVYGNEARFATKSRTQDNMVGMFSYTGSTYNGGINFFAHPYSKKQFILSFDNPICGDIIISKSDGYMEVRFLSGGVISVAERSFPITRIFSKQFIVPNGTALQFLKADGSLDSNSYALHTDLNAVKNNAWKLDIANPECETVVIALQQGQGIFEAMEKAGIDYSKSRNIYVDLSAAGEWSGENIFAGYEKAPIGVRYHIFFGNVKTAIKLYWASSIESNKLSGNLALTAEYPTAKCEFMRVTDSWTYADWEALIDEVSHVIDTGTASESDNSTLVNYMDNNKIPYSKTMKGALVNITALLAALAGSK